MVVKKTIKKGDDKKDSVSNKTVAKKALNKKATSKKNSKKTNNDYWMFATILLGMLLIGLSTLYLSTLNLGSSGVSVISEQEAGDLILEFAKTQGVDATLVETIYEGGIYSVTVSVSGQEFPPLYLTGDGKNLVNGQLVPLEEVMKTPKMTGEATQEESIPTSDKPEVELYIWSYCPYGVQAQGPLAEVVSLLEDTVEFTIVPYYDGHGAF